MQECFSISSSRTGIIVSPLSGALRGSGPGSGFPWTTEKKPNKASWNVFLDAVSAAQVWTFGLATVVLSDNAFEHLQVDPSDPGMYTPRNCTNKLLADVMLNWAPAHNAEWSGLSYWDQATAVVMMQQLLTKESACQRWVESNITISLQNDATYATYHEGSLGAPSEELKLTTVL